MKNQKTIFNNIQLPNEDVKQIIEENLYQKSMQKVDNSDVNINHLET